MGIVSVKYFSFCSKPINLKIATIVHNKLILTAQMHTIKNFFTKIIYNSSVKAYLDRD